VFITSDLVEALAVEVVAALTSVPLLAHEPDVAEHRQVLRQPRAGSPAPQRELAHGLVGRRPAR